MGSQAIDYDALAKANGGTPDYDSIAAANGGQEVGASSQHSKQHSWIDDAANAVGHWWNQVNPVQNAQGIANMVAHPMNALSNYSQQNNAIEKQAEDAFKGGHYAEGIRHVLEYAANAIPGVGSTLNKAGNEAQSGDVSGAVGDTAGLATNLFGPAVVKNVGPKAVAAAGEAGNAIKDYGQATLQPNVARTAADNISVMHPARVVGKLYDTIQNNVNDIRAQQVVKRTREAVAAQRATNRTLQGRPPVWEQGNTPPDVESPGQPSPPPAAPAQLPSGKVPGSIAAQSQQPGARPAPKWAGLPAPDKEILPDLTPIQSQLPSGRTPGSIAAQSQPAPPTPATPNAETAYPIPQEQMTAAPTGAAPREAYQAAARTVKARAMARWLKIGGISHEDAQLMQPNDWKLAAQGAGVNEPSAQSIQQALSELKAMYASNAQ